MSRKENLLKLIALYERRLQILREQKAIRGPDVPPDVLIQIEDIVEEIAKLEKELGSLGDNDLGEKFQGDLKPRNWVQVYLYDDFHGLTPEYQATKIDELAALMGTSPQAIEVLRVHSQKIALDLNVPSDAIQYLHSLLQSNGGQLSQLRIEKVILETKSGEIERWVNKQGKYDLAISPENKWPVQDGWPIRWIVAAALVIVLLVIGVAYLFIPRDEPPPPLLIVQRRSVSEIQLDGLLDESAWVQEEPLTYVVHPAENGSTTATVYFLWDDDYLYVGFDINDTEVETSDLSTIWDSDTVSLLLHDGGIHEHRLSLGEELDDYRKFELKPRTTLNNPNDTDNGYTVEMRIRWRQPPLAGRRIRADLLSVDHDGNPGATAGDPGTVFSKLTWDRDNDIANATGSLLLVDGEPSGGD